MRKREEKNKFSAQLVHGLTRPGTDTRELLGTYHTARPSTGGKPSTKDAQQLPQLASSLDTAVLVSTGR